LKNIHIGYGDSATGCLLEAMKDHGLPGDDAVPSRDDFTQGPISECLQPNGLEQRIGYWEAVDKVLGFGFDTRTFYNESIRILDELETDEITLWVGDSCHDILATGWLLSYLQGKQFNWFLVDLVNVEKSDYPGEMPAVNLAMYTPDKLIALYKYRRPLDTSNLTYFTSLWKKATEENSHYRIKRGNEIISVKEDYFDDYILSFVPDQFKPTSKIIGDVLRDGRHNISDTTVEWNIRKMIGRSLIVYQGDLNTMSTYSIRIEK